MPTCASRKIFQDKYMYQHSDNDMNDTICMYLFISFDSLLTLAVDLWGAGLAGLRCCIAFSFFGHE